MRGWYIEALVIAASVSAGQFIAINIDQKKMKDKAIFENMKWNKNELHQYWKF